MPSFILLCNVFVKHTTQLACLYFLTVCYIKAGIWVHFQKFTVIYSLGAQHKTLKFILI